MNTSEEIARGGVALRKIREGLGLSMREVERRSLIVARQKKYSEYYVSHNYLSSLEKGTAYPHLLKLYSLAAIYHRRSTLELVSLFGFSFREAAVDDMRLGLPKTALIAPAAAQSQEEARSIVAPSGLKQSADFAHTNLVTRMFESWGHVPVPILERMDLRNALYGYVGTRDNTLFPLIRPGSFVQIDSRQRKIATSWKDEFDRPIYFLELRDGYACSWCELEERQLLLLPTVQSGAKSRHVRYPGEAEILGRVTAVTMRIAEVFPAEARRSDGSAG